MIHIVNPQTSEILDYITLDNIIEDTHKKSLESYIETYDAIVLGGAGFSYDKHLEKRNHIIIPDEDGAYQEFVLFEVDKYRDTEGRKTHFYAHATYLELKKAKVIYPTRREGFTLSQHAGWALNDTGWRVGIVESEGVRTFNIENHTNPYEFLKRLANEFEVEIRFRVEHDGRRITARYVDFLERIGDWKGREVEFGRDLDSIRRIEKQDVVTALLGLGPEREDGTRLEVFVEDEEALRRWGRVDEHGNLHHLIEPYEIQSDRQEMTEEEARQYTRTALDKRINTQVTYETTILDLEEVPGLEHEKIRFGDTIRIKDTYFNPPLYLEARVYEIERSIKNKAKKDIKLGDYIEYTEEEVNAIWNQLLNEIRRRLDRMAIVTINSSAGNIFKNAQGETELTARTFVNGAERDEDGTLYDYQWMRFDKDGNHDTEFYAEGKTITVTANDIDEKATYRVLVAYELEVINTAEITISNVFDGEDGEPGPPGPPGEDGKTFYTWIKYADTPTSGMSDSPEGKEYIGIAYNKETPTPSTNYDDYIWAKFKGEQGIPGPPGEDGQPTYTWVKYADDEYGNGMSDSPDGKLYIGLAFNKTTPEESNNPADYTWSLMPQNIEIGGRNLLLDSHFYNSSGGWIAVNSPLSRENDVITIYADGSNIGATRFQLTTVIKETGVYTLSAKVKATTGLQFRGFVGTTATNQSIHQTNNEWTVISTQFEIDEPEKEIIIRLYLQDGSAGQVASMDWAKLEKGHKATDWTPAPEDVQGQIDGLGTRVTNAETSITQLSNQIELKAEQTTVDTLANRISSAESSINLLSDEIQLKVDKDGVISAINLSPETAKLQASKIELDGYVEAKHIKSLNGLNVNDQFIVDSNGNVKLANDTVTIDRLGIKVKEADFLTEDAQSGIVSKIVPMTNLIRDHSFELIKAGSLLSDGYYRIAESPVWYLQGSPRCTNPYPDGTDVAPIAPFGDQSILVNSSNFVIDRESSWYMNAGETYTLSAYFHRPIGYGVGTPQFRIRLFQYDGATGTEKVLYTSTSDFAPVPSNYSLVRYSHTFTLPSNFEWEFPTTWVEIEIKSTNSTWVVVDGVQLVRGTYPTAYDAEDSLWRVAKGYIDIDRTGLFWETLWSGVVYLRDDHMIYPSKPLSECTRGWVLQWQAYDPGVGIQNHNHQYTHIPKTSLFNAGRGHRVLLIRGSATYVNKYFYVYDTYITGVAENGQGDNRNLVLSAIYEY